MRRINRDHNEFMHRIFREYIRSKLVHHNTQSTTGRTPNRRKIIIQNGKNPGHCRGDSHAGGDVVRTAR